MTGHGIEEAFDQSLYCGRIWQVISGGYLLLRSSYFDIPTTQECKGQLENLENIGATNLEDYLVKSK